MKTNQKRTAKAICSEVMVAWEAATVTCVVAETQSRNQGGFRGPDWRLWAWGSCGRAKEQGASYVIG